MFSKKSEHRHVHPYVTLTVGALAFVGALSIMKCAKSMMRCGCDKMSSMMKDMMCRGKGEMCEQ